MFHFQLVELLTATIIAGVIGVSGFLLQEKVETGDAYMVLTPDQGVVQVGETFTMQVLVTAIVPVNVFKGDLQFDPAVLEVVSIDYNTSIADLWAEAPWYKNGDGTLGFIGGTTKPGGFTGSDVLITVTFKTKATGDTRVSMQDARILKHDGLGTEIPSPHPLDAVFTVESEMKKNNPVFETIVTEPILSIVKNKRSTDLNNDGKQSIADVSIFMTDFATQNLRSDFNDDGKVDMRDLSILTS